MLFLKQMSLLEMMHIKTYLGITFEAGTIINTCTAIGFPRSKCLFYLYIYIKPSACYFWKGVLSVKRFERYFRGSIANRHKDEEHKHAAPSTHCWHSGKPNARNHKCTRYFKERRCGSEVDDETDATRAVRCTRQIRHDGKKCRILSACYGLLH